MKRTILLVAVALLVSTTAAIVGGPEPDDGEMAIMSGGSSASGSAAVGPNGTKWESSVEMRGRNTDIKGGERVENTSITENKTTFSGYIQAPTPCHILDQKIKHLDAKTYVLNVKTMKDEVDNQSQICAQQVVLINYEGSFEAEAPYSLEIQHNNQTVDTLENTVEEESTEKKDKNAIKAFLGWLSHLF